MKQCKKVESDTYFKYFAKIFSLDAPKTTRAGGKNNTANLVG